MSPMTQAPRIKSRPIYKVRECTEGGGRTHWHVTAFGRDVVIGADRFTFAEEATAQKEADRLNKGDCQRG